MGRGTGRRTKPRRLVPTYLVVVEGKSEKVYLNQLKKLGVFPKRVKLLPELTGRGNIQQQGEYFISTVKKNPAYSHYFWVIDLDVVFRDRQVERLKGVLNELAQRGHRSPFDKVTTIFNCPCLEYWFFLHFWPSKNFGVECGRVVKFLRDEKPDIFAGYQKSEQQLRQIAERLEQFRDIAIKNSRTRGCPPRESKLEEWFSCSEMWKLFEKIK